MGTELALQFAEWVKEQADWAEANDTRLELVLFPADAEAALVESVTETDGLTQDDSVTWIETKDHRVSIRLHDVKIGFDSRIPAGQYMLRFGHASDRQGESDVD